MMRSTTSVKAIAATALCAVAIGTSAGNAAAAPTNTEGAKSVSTAQEASPTQADVEQALNLINEIPDEVLLKGDKATADWFTQHNQSQLTARASIWGCTGAVLALVGGNLVSAAKLLKIKKLIDDLGGVTDAVKLMWGASFNYEKLQAAGGALGALAAEFFGISAVKSQCFD